MTLLTYILAAVLVFVPIRVHASTYTTAFPATENPISEGGQWTNGLAVGLDWSNIRTTPALAFGTQTGTDGFNDSIAVLKGNWNANQYARGVAKCTSTGGGFDEEVELLLRFTIAAHAATGYEINFSCSGTTNAYMTVVRWDTPTGTFVQLSQVLGTGIVNADVLEATIIGSAIKVYKNGSEVSALAVTDTTYTTGSPGMGFFNQNAGRGRNSEFGWTSYTACSLSHRCRARHRHAPL
jgi:hypothetical protein